MRKLWLSVFLTTLLSCAFLSSMLWIVAPLIASQQRMITSPIPSFLTLARNAQVTTIDLWEPFKQVVLGASITTPSITAKSAITYDLTTNTILYDRDPSERLPMASLTKIMTAIVALEHPKTDNRYIVPASALVGEDSMGLDAGEQLSLEELLYGMMLHSGNDAAEVFAYNFSGGRDAFIKAMNDKAAALGLKDTHFTNPTGLQGDGDQYTTTYDLVTITRYALEHFPLFAQVAATFDHDIPATNTHKEFYLENETNLLSSYPGVKGVKTGYTPEAGLCLVTYLDYKGHHIIGVVLNSESRRDDMKELLDYSLKKLGITPPHHS